MTLDDAKKKLNCRFNYELADLLGISNAAISGWNEQKIPELREYQIHKKAIELQQAQHMPVNLQSSAQQSNI
ncbi:hypothetical protein I5735_18295 [Acinetobacter baumannii]|uniref:hypothetical protein n=1 Tax=Acinetobacter bereziniae TaxID=106648 RepID=UPI0018FF6757|nr:hypothetical protein [Acinetobacter baumannii]